MKLHRLPPQNNKTVAAWRAARRNQKRLAARASFDAILYDPEDLEQHRASCFIKMSTVSIEAFRQAFLGPESRIRLHSDPMPEHHAKFIAMTWEGGFLRDTAVHFNENLNVLVGGRCTGKIDTDRKHARRDKGRAKPAAKSHEEG